MDADKATALQECVSRKIPKLIDEGYERDQAIAIAYSECSEKSWNELPESERRAWLEWANLMKCEKAERKALTCIKRIGENRVGGYGVVWGDSEHTDLHGEYFTPATNFFLPPRELPAGEPVPVAWPCLYDHAVVPLPSSAVKADDARDYVMGIVDTVRKDDIGLWIEAQIQAHEEWVKRVLELIDQGVLHWSSGSSAYLVKRADDGWLQNWPIVEMSATPAPAEPRHTRIALKHYLDDDLRRKEQPVEGARRSGTASISRSHDSKQQERNMSITKRAALAMIRAYAQAEHENILNAIKQAEENGETGDNMIVEALRPLAEELARLAGVEVEEALSELVSFVAGVLAREHQAEQPSEAPAEELPEVPSAMSAQIQKTVEAVVSKTLRDLLPEQPQGGLVTRKNVNINVGRDNRPLTLGGWIKAIMQKRWDILEREHPRIKAEHKALGIDPDTAGGYLVPVAQTNQIIEMLRSETVVLPLCRQLPLNSATLAIPAQTGGAQAYWIGENEQIPASQPTFGQKLLVAKKMAVRVILSNELLEDSDPAIDAIIREDIARAAAEEMDRVILEGTGLNGEPLGVLYAGATVTALNAAPSYQALSAAVKRIETANVSRNPVWAWVFSPREKHTLRMLEDTAGNLIFAGPGPYQQAVAGALASTLLDYPWYATNIIEPDANSETRMYFGQWQDVVVGLRKSLEIMASAEAGTAFENDQTWIRAILRMDVVLRHPESIEVLSDVRES